LQMMKMDDAAAKIQHSFRAWQWNRRCWRLVHSTVVAQRLLKGAIVRKWLKDCHYAATLIQKTFRRMLVCVVLNPKGRDMMRKQQKEMSDMLAKKAEMGESLYYARTAVAAAKFKLAMAKHRDVNVEIRRSMSFSIKSAYARRLDKQKKLRLKGILQPVRFSVFEPIAFAVKRLAQQGENKPARMGAPPSKVGACVAKARRELERAFALAPQEGQKEKDILHSHAAARAGRRAARVRRLAKAPKLGAAAPAESLVDDSGFEKWMAAQFAVKQHR